MEKEEEYKDLEEKREKMMERELGYEGLQKKFNILKRMRDALFVPETKKILPLLKEFKNKKVHVR